MTVRELIALLSEQNLDMRIMLLDYDFEDDPSVYDARRVEVRNDEVVIS